MMEKGQDSAVAKGANYGTAALSRTAGGPWPDRRAATPVHANVDLPFRPLAPFVPDSHWQRLERSGDWLDRIKTAIAALIARACG